ncbi:titin homolog [Littorina saxatilis]|uniref:titin homolog n=1 Tax=Littorina saxatilis TaxID=31220 RepID=UPI0038B51175
MHCLLLWLIVTLHLPVLTHSQGNKTEQQTQSSVQHDLSGGFVGTEAGLHKSDVKSLSNSSRSLRQNQTWNTVVLQHTLNTYLQKKTAEKHLKGQKNALSNKTGNEQNRPHPTIPARASKNQMETSSSRMAVMVKKIIQNAKSDSHEALHSSHYRDTVKGRIVAQKNNAASRLPDAFVKRVGFSWSSLWNNRLPGKTTRNDLRKIRYPGPNGRIKFEKQYQVYKTRQRGAQRTSKKITAKQAVMLHLHKDSRVVGNKAASQTILQRQNLKEITAASQKQPWAVYQVHHVFRQWRGRKLNTGKSHLAKIPALSNVQMTFPDTPNMAKAPKSADGLTNRHPKRKNITVKKQDTLKKANPEEIGNKPRSNQKIFKKILAKYDVKHSSLVPLNSSNSSGNLQESNSARIVSTIRPQTPDSRRNIYPTERPDSSPVVLEQKTTLLEPNVRIGDKKPSQETPLNGKEHVFIVLPPPQHKFFKFAGDHRTETPAHPKELPANQKLFVLPESLNQNSVSEELSSDKKLKIVPESLGNNSVPPKLPSYQKHRVFNESLNQNSTINGTVHNDTQHKNNTSNATHHEQMLMKDPGAGKHASTQQDKITKKDSTNRRRKRDTDNIFTDIVGHYANLDDVIEDFIGVYPLTRARDRRTIEIKYGMTDRVKSRIALERIARDSDSVRNDVEDESYISSLDNRKDDLLPSHVKKRDYRASGSLDVSGMTVSEDDTRLLENDESNVAGNVFDEHFQDESQDRPVLHVFQDYRDDSLKSAEERNSPFPDHDVLKTPTDLTSSTSEKPKLDYISGQIAPDLTGSKMKKIKRAYISGKVLKLEAKRDIAPMVPGNPSQLSASQRHKIKRDQATAEETKDEQSIERIVGENRKEELGSLNVDRKRSQSKLDRLTPFWRKHHQKPNPVVKRSELDSQKRSSRRKRKEKNPSSEKSGGETVLTTKKLGGSIKRKKKRSEKLQKHRVSGASSRLSQGAVLPRSKRLDASQSQLNSQGVEQSVNSESGQEEPAESQLKKVLRIMQTRSLRMRERLQPKPEDEDTSEAAETDIGDAFFDHIIQDTKIASDELRMDDRVPDVIGTSRRKRKKRESLERGQLGDKRAFREAAVRRTRRAADSDDDSAVEDDASTEPSTEETEEKQWSSDGTADDKDDDDENDDETSFKGSGDDMEQQKLSFDDNSMSAEIDVPADNDDDDGDAEDKEGDGNTSDDDTDPTNDVRAKRSPNDSDDGEDDPDSDDDDTDSDYDYDDIDADDASPDDDDNDNTDADVKVKRSPNDSDEDNESDDDDGDDDADDANPDDEGDDDTDADEETTIDVRAKRSPNDSDEDNESDDDDGDDDADDANPDDDGDDDTDADEETTIDVRAKRSPNDSDEDNESDDDDGDDDADDANPDDDGDDDTDADEETTIDVRAKRSPNDSDEDNESDDDDGDDDADDANPDDDGDDDTDADEETTIDVRAKRSSNDSDEDNESDDDDGDDDADDANPDDDGDDDTDADEETSIDVKVKRSTNDSDDDNKSGDDGGDKDSGDAKPDDGKTNAEEETIGIKVEKSESNEDNTSGDDGGDKDSGDANPDDGKTNAEEETIGIKVEESESNEDYKSGDDGGDEGSDDAKPEKDSNDDDNGDDTDGKGNDDDNGDDKDGKGNGDDDQNNGKRNTPRKAGKVLQVVPTAKQMAKIDEASAKIMSNSFFKEVDKLVDADEDCPDVQEEMKDDKDYYESVYGEYSAVEEASDTDEFFTPESQKGGKYESKTLQITKDNMKKQVQDTQKKQEAQDAKNKQAEDTKNKQGNDPQKNQGKDAPKKQEKVVEKEEIKVVKKDSNGKKKTETISIESDITKNTSEPEVLPGEFVSRKIPGYIDDRTGSGQEDIGIETAASAITRMLMDEHEENAVNEVF